MDGKPRLWALIKADCAANHNHKKWIVPLILFRLAHRHASAPAWLKPLTALCVVLYRFVSEILLSSEIHWRAEIGPGLSIWHGFTIVINDAVRIGRNCTLHHGVTIGLKDPTSGAPTIGDNVWFGASSIALGGITIGDNAVIGAGAVVLKDVPAGAIVVGNPARIVQNDAHD